MGMKTTVPDAPGQAASQDQFAGGYPSVEQELVPSFFSRP